MPHHAARLVAALTPVTGEPTDAELLARFVADRDAGAFELLVWRHAGLVLRTCRGVLGNRHSAEDAAQAVFLALARQAASVGRSGSVAGWLFRVARRIAVRAARRSTLPIAPPLTSTRFPKVTRHLHRTPTSTVYSTRNWPGCRMCTGPRYCCASSRGYLMRTQLIGSDGRSELWPGASRGPRTCSRLG